MGLLAHRTLSASSRGSVILVKIYVTLEDD